MGNAFQRSITALNHCSVRIEGIPVEETHGNSRSSVLLGFNMAKSKRARYGFGLPLARVCPLSWAVVLWTWRQDNRLPFGPLTQ